MMHITQYGNGWGHLETSNRELAEEIIKTYPRLTLEKGKIVGKIKDLDEARFYCKSGENPSYQ